MKLRESSLLLMLIGLNFLGFGQDLTLTNGTSIHILSNTVFFASCLEFDSTTNFQITTPNAIARSSTPINAQSINRVITMDNAIFNYQGTLTLHYEDSELNGINESDLVLNVEDEFNTRTTYTGTIDTFLNTLSYDFASAINVLSVTATDGTTLSMGDFEFQHISLYPNPTTNIVNVVSDFDLITEVFDLNGRKMLQSSKQTIDISHLPTGAYLFKVRTDSDHLQKVFKILKY